MATQTQLEKAPPALGQVLNGGPWSGLWSLAWMRWTQLAPAQRSWVMVAALMIGTLLGGLFWYGLSPDWRTLYSGLEPDDARQMEQVLAESQIPFEPSADGSGILVPAALLDKARLAAAAKGGVKSGRLGFEIFDKPNWLGSEFDEQVNFQRALEGELERTIGTLSDVASARVHLVLPHDSLFRDQERPAKAAVVIKMRHRSLADGEPDAIRNLVASAVDGLLPEHVVLVDAAGNSPLGPQTAEAMQLSSEQALQDKLIATLEPVTGVGNVRASVTLDYDTQAAEETNENYAPGKTATLVVGNPERVRRLTAAIVVNDRLLQPATSDHAAVWQPRSANELRNLTALAQAAVGFDSTRGDVVTVQDLAFDDNRSQPPVTLTEQGLRTAEDSPDLVKYAALLLGLLVVVAFVLRPAIRHAGAALATLDASKDARRKLPANSEAAYAQTPLSAPAPPEMKQERLRSQEIFDQVSDHVKREPTQSSRLLQSWIHSDRNPGSTRET
jgi:flagellar M-ring protein FliF